jgi:putative endonuclease
MLRCEDNSIYTGIAADLKHRMEEHFSRNEKCAKYTLVHHAKKLEAAWQSEDRALASKLEYYIKKLSKKQKEELIIKNDFSPLEQKLDRKKYDRIMQ